MSAMKTIETDASVDAFLASLANRGRAEDAAEVAEMMSRVSGAPPRMWGDALIGFGAYEYARSDGSVHRFCLTGVSPRKANLAVYVMDGVSAYADQLDRLGPHKRAASCLYLGRLNKIDLSVLEEIISLSLAEMKRRYP
ncbi:MAG: DUF1801 domain-containing protein [Pseudomonadota bacterium]